MRNSIGYKERNAIFARLVQVCRKPPGDEFAVYDPGHDDDTVAAEMTERLGRTIAPTNVAFVRKSEIGLLRPPRVPAPSPKTLAEEAASIWAAVTEISSLLQKIEARLVLLEKLSPKQGSL
jgi:hypothetical protein